MTIRKYLGCDGPECISSVEVPLTAPLRDLLPEHWRALMIEGSAPELASVDVHFCSLACLYHWTAQRISDEAIAEGATRGDLPEDPPDAAASGVPNGPQDPKPSMDTGALPSAVERLNEQLRQAMAGIFNPPASYTYKWPQLLGPRSGLMGNGASGMAGAAAGARWDASPYLLGIAGAINR